MFKLNSVHAEIDVTHWKIMGFEKKIGYQVSTVTIVKMIRILLSFQIIDCAILLSLII